MKLFISAVFAAFIIAAMFTSTAMAVEDVYQFETEEQRDRFSELTFELRCPKCQNQNIADSDAPIAEDLRNEVSRLIKKGDDDDQIVQHLVDRYGEFVLYEPRFDLRTAIIWLTPLLLLVIGVVVIASLSRSKKKAHEVTELSEQERARLQEILANESDDISTSNGKSGDK